ncbi:MAG: PfkB family carbohydrate kinase [Gordonia sp. (in: high G+C Gram-positive bacteria)]
MSEVHSRGLIVTVGDLVEDIVVWPGRDILRGTDNPSRITRGRGGSAANVAAFVATEIDSRYIGRVGDDAAGRALVEQLSYAGVEVMAQRAGRTGTIVVCVSPDGERTMFPDRAAAGELADVPPEWVDGASALLISAYAFARHESATAAIALAGRARHQHARIAVDLASVDLITALGTGAMLDILRKLSPTVCFANRDESTLVAAEQIVGLGSIYVVKNGADPVVIHSPHTTAVTIPVRRVEEVSDTTGAGDAFAAGFLIALERGESIESAAAAGNAMAARVLANPGASLEPRVPHALSQSGH